jgi:precorrin-6B methylase 2
MTVSGDLTDKNRPLKLGPSQLEIHVVATAQRYRRLARELPLPTDSALEIGCSTGMTTRVLARSCASVVAVDIDPERVKTLQADLAHIDSVRVSGADGRLPADLAALIDKPDLIFMDVGGNALLDNVACVLRQCLRAFSPRVLVVRSYELSAVFSLVKSVEKPDYWFRQQVDPADSLGLALESLLDLSRSSSKDSRLLAARKLRQLGTPEALARLREMADDPHPRVRRAANPSNEPSAEAQA